MYCDFEHSLKVSLKCKAWCHFDEQILLESKRKCSSIMVSMLFFGWTSLGSYSPKKFEYVHPLHPYISMQVLHTVIYTFPIVLVRRICLTVKSFLSL